MANVGDKIYIHELTYHDGEYGVIVNISDSIVGHKVYEAMLEDGGSAYLYRDEFDVMEKEEE